MHKYLILFFVICSFSVLAENSIKTKNVELTKVSSQIKQLQKTIKIDRQQQNNLEQSLKNTEISISTLSLQINHFNQAILQEQQQLNNLKNSHQLIQNKLNQQHAVLAKQLRTAYQLKPLNSIKIILNQENPNTIQRHLTYYHHLTSARLHLITNIKQSLSILESNMLEITQHQQNLKKLLEQKQDQQNQQQQAQAKRQHLLSQLHQNVLTKQQQLNSLTANQKTLQDVIKRLNSQVRQGVISSNNTFTQLRGKLRWPVNGELTANYGSSLDVAGMRLSGVIINAAQNTPIRAIYNGNVIFANWLRGFGLLVIINHDNNYMSLYGRNHVLYRKVGDHVNTGDIIATTGNSGGFDKPGLYFEIRQNGMPVNPNIWCR